jgi:maleylacetate reductase
MAVHFQSSFVYPGGPTRVVFGAESLSRVDAECDRLDVKRILLVSSPDLGPQAQRVGRALGNRLGSVFYRAEMHTPVHVTEAALPLLSGGIDGLVAVGGGSAIGLAKALALRSNLPQIAVPTTFAGSEATPILGQTVGGEKITTNDLQLLPATIIYDPAMVCTLPMQLAVDSTLNAIAHAVEALYARDRNPISSLMAVEGVRALVAALPQLQQDRGDMEAWSKAQYGAWLCGTVLGQVGMSLHHKLCHVLGGSFGLPHAPVHAAILPHAVAYNEATVPDLLEPIAALFNARAASAGLRGFSERVGASTALGPLGFEERNIPRAVEAVLARSYWNPRRLTAEGLRAILIDATHGHAPAQSTAERAQETLA